MTSKIKSTTSYNFYIIGIHPAAKDPSFDTQMTQMISLSKFCQHVVHGPMQVELILSSTFDLLSQQTHRPQKKTTGEMFAQRLATL